MTTWDEQIALLIDLARTELEAGYSVPSAMIGMRHDQPLAIVGLRPYAKGEHHEAVIEAAALFAGMDATHVALMLTGRAWSTADPIPPVLEGVGDLRQTVLVINEARRDGQTFTHMAPYDGAELGEFNTMAGGEGRVIDILQLAVSGTIAAPDEVPSQLARLMTLGHNVALA